MSYSTTIVNKICTGLIIKSQSGFFTVHCEAGSIECRIRGQLNHKRLDTDLATIGDKVIIDVLEDGTGIIQEVCERNSVLARRLPSSSSENKPEYKDHAIQQVLIANVDQAIFVFSCQDPTPNFKMLDRFLVIAAANDIPAIICANKIDLIGLQNAVSVFGLYHDIGYKILYTSTLTKQGVKDLKRLLPGKVSVLAGPSGVGKSTLLNTINPDLGLRVNEISQSNSKGKHTTVYPQLIPIDDEGWVADTPGLRALDFFDIEPEELDAYFIEIAPLVSECAFSNCTHTHEPSCAVISALIKGTISESRYNSLLQMRKQNIQH
ncbi:MAG: ribosome small subunit-dependent GTPase A [Anaerolineaceae bacterium]|nr:ribosome small subunit-dependent GTPase A [Anaerolineaceae bacterium]